MTLLKGALVSFTPTFIPLPIPNITVFQYNPESLTHTWTQPYSPDGTPGTESGDAFAVAGPPGEEFSLTVMFDSNQDIADSIPVSAQLAEVSGVYSRLAALEMLLYPVPGASSPASQLVGQVSAALSSGDQSASTAPPQMVVPVALFVWGPFRIVPVRVTGLTIVEKLYDELLNPINAEVQLSLRVVNPAELEGTKPGNPVMAALASAAYTYTLDIREAGALANLGNAGASIAGEIGGIL